jgi:adenosine deaminase
VDGKAVRLGDLAQYVLDKRIPLEICLLSNLHTGAARSLSEHPFKILYQEKFGLSLEDFEKITISAMKSAFLPYDQRCDFIYSAIKPAYAKVRNSQATK